MKNKKEIIKISALILISIVLAGLTCSYLIVLTHLKPENQRYLTFILENINITKVAIISLLYSVCSIILYKWGEIIGEFLYKYRYIIAVIVFILCIIFEISGSSIGMWRYCIGSDLPSSGEVLGTQRAIRGDEWAVFTPFAMSQDENSPETYSYFSNTIRGDKTDVYIVYGQPVKDISIIFRPFQIGYLLFGAAKGLSFFWCGRFIALFLVSFELSMLITKKRKDISLVFAILITLAPATQWWFSINGLVEMIVFGGIAILLLQKYMTTDNFLKRILYLFVIGICGGGYLLTFYPAWEIPMAFVFLALAIWVIVENRKECKIKLKDILSIIFVVLVIIGLLLNIYIKSKDTISSVMNTAYPGARCETGGDRGMKYFSYPANLFFSLDENDLGSNACEAAVFFDLFPLGFILSAIVIFKQKKKDLLLILLLILSCIFAIWEIFGLPKILAKLTLLYISPAYRTFVIVGFLNMLVLIRAMALIEKKTLWIMEKAPIAVIIPIIVLVICLHVFPDYFDLKKIVLSYIALFTMYLACMEICSQQFRKISISSIAIIMMFTSFLVNPVRKGIDVIKEQPVGKEIKQIQQKESGLWIVEGMGYPMFNFPIMYGAPTINSTNVYPNLDRWKKLDPEGKYEDIYNRYAHIVIELTDEEEARFELLVVDSFKVYLPVNKLKDLDVKYIFTSNDLDKFNKNQNAKKEKISLNKLYNEYNVFIYEVK